MADGVVGIAKRIQDIDIAGIPIGAAALGGGSALILSELTDGLLVPRIPTVPVVAIKAGETYAMHRWGHKAIGAGGARVATLFLGYDTLRTLIPIEKTIKDIIAKIPGIPGAVAATSSNPGPEATPPPGGNGHQGDAMTFLRNSVAAATGGGA